MPSSRSTTSSSRSSRPNSLLQDAANVPSYGRDGTHNGGGGGGDDDDTEDDVSVETLVEHLLAARRALGTINQVLRGNELATQARALHTDAVVWAAQTAFLRRGICEQVNVLLQIRRGMDRAYDAGRRDFRSLIHTLDEANGQLEHTMDVLRATTVAATFRPPGEEPRNLLDFVDEAGVEALRDALKQSIAELQAAQTSFDGDLLRFDTDLRALNKAMAAAPPPPPPLPTTLDLPLEAHEDNDPSASATAYPPIPHLLASLTTRSHIMAEHLASLTRHFDLCVTAVRTTEGGPALARWKASNTRDASCGGGSGAGTEPVSISGVIAEQEAAAASNGNDNDNNNSNVTNDLEPLSAHERAEMLHVVLQDAAEVDGVVADLSAELHAAEAEFAAVRAHAERTQAAHVATLAAFRVLADELGPRLSSYAAAETEFAERWANERAIIADRLADMDDLRTFYEGYAHAYDTLILEAARRRAVDTKIATVWRKARDAVARIVAADSAERAGFRQEVGAYLPTDLWQDIDVPPQDAAYPPPLTGEGGVVPTPSHSTKAANRRSRSRSRSRTRTRSGPDIRSDNRNNSNADDDPPEGETADDGRNGGHATDPTGSSRGAGGSSTRTVIERR